MKFALHLAFAALISFGLSIWFWLGMGVFDLVGFWLVSIVCALLGATGGWFLGKRLVMTGAVTLTVRLAVFYLVTSAGA